MSDPTQMNEYRAAVEPLRERIAELEAIVAEKDREIARLTSDNEAYFLERQQIRGLLPVSGEDNDFSLLDCIRYFVGKHT